MKRSRFLVVLGIAFLVVVGASTTEAQLPKQGSYSGSFGAQGVGTLHEFEAGHIFFVGGFNGVFMNDESGGFLDRTQVICPGINDIVDGLSQGLQGYCIATDEDGDKAFFKWTGIDDTPNVGAAGSSGPAAPANTRESPVATRFITPALAPLSPIR